MRSLELSTRATETDSLLAGSCARSAASSLRFVDPRAHPRAAQASVHSWPAVESRRDADSSLARPFLETAVLARALADERSASEAASLLVLPGALARGRSTTATRTVGRRGFLRLAGAAATAASFGGPRRALVGDRVRGHPVHVQGRVRGLAAARLFAVAPCPDSLVPPWLWAPEPGSPGKGRATGL